jgi:hypothetical protein
MDEQSNEPTSEHLVDSWRIDRQTEADAGTKMFVTFFLLLAPALGVLLLAAVCWSLYKMLLAA